MSHTKKDVMQLEVPNTPYEILLQKKLNLNLIKSQLQVYMKYRGNVENSTHKWLDFFKKQIIFSYFSLDNEEEFMCKDTTASEKLERNKEYTYQWLHTQVGVLETTGSRNMKWWGHLP